MGVTGREAHMIHLEGFVRARRIIDRIESAHSVQAYEVGREAHRPEPAQAADRGRRRWLVRQKRLAALGR